MSRIILNITGAIVVEKNTNNTDIETKDSHHTNSERTEYIECGTTLNKRKQKERTPKRKRVSRMPDVNYHSLPQCPEPEPETSDGEPRPVQPGRAPVDTQSQPGLVCLRQWAKLFTRLAILQTRNMNEDRGCEDDILKSVSNLVSSE